MEEALTFRDRDGHRVAAILTTPEAPTDRVVLLCHGFLSGKNSTTNKTLTRALTEQGIATFRFDFFGQGDSEGPFEALTVTIALGQALAALDLLTARGYKRIGLIGSSFGGLVALLTPLRNRNWPAWVSSVRWRTLPKSFAWNSARPAWHAGRRTMKSRT